MMPKMGHSSPRLGFEMGAPPYGDRLSAISPDFQGNPGQPNPWVSKMAPFLLANHGCRLPKLWVKLRASEGGLEMMSKMGHP